MRPRRSRAAARSEVVRLLAALAVVLLLSGCSYALTPWKFNWREPLRCFDDEQGYHYRSRGTRLTLKVAPVDRSPVEVGLLVDEDGSASYSTNWRGATACLSFRMSDIEALDRLWGNEDLLANAPEACGPRLSLVEGGAPREGWTFRSCGPHRRSDEADACRSGDVAMAGRAASSMRNVWLEYVGPGEESHVDFRWDFSAPLPELYEGTLVETLGLLCARSAELAAAFRERLPVDLARRIDCGSARR